MTSKIMAALSAQEAQELLDHAAKQSDRWLFLAAVVVLLACLIGAILYLAKWVRAVIDEMKSERHELSEVIRANTAVLTLVNDRLHNTRP